MTDERDGVRHQRRILRGALLVESKLVLVFSNAGDRSEVVLADQL